MWKKAVMASKDSLRTLVRIVCVQVEIRTEWLRNTGENR
jgi:hypothetical protein